MEAAGSIATAVEGYVVEERVGYIAVAQIARDDRIGPGKIGMIEHVEELGAYFKPVPLKRELEGFV
ncbi:MAG TPA: hypothetical protein VKN18_19860 [Blastocatellia bacterium]|nr:hypothetical protein [Blastocatellia bacterium]